jgi:hypothetical protein
MKKNEDYCMEMEKRISSHMQASLE